MMKFLLALCLTSFATAVDISSDSVQGKRLLSKARSVKDGRQLDEAYYATWMTKYSMKFDGCHSVPQFERDEGMRSMLLAKFKMCPSDNCNKCPNAGEYIVEMRDFVEAYQEAKQQMNEYACESQMETCQYQCENGMYQYQNDDNVQNNNNNQNNQNNNNNNNGDQNDYCYYTCMSDNNMAYCDNDNNGGNGDMNMEEMMECRQLGGEGGGNNNNNQYYAANSNYQVYFVGAYCDSTGVYVDTFTDSSCTKHAPKGTYEKYSGGYSLPTVSFVGTDCISCRAPEENNGQNNNNNNQNNNNGNNNNNNNQNYYYNEEVFETCEKLYEDAGKCEKNMDVQYKNNGACELMHGTLARLDNAFHHKGKAAVVLAWVFGAFVLLLGSYVVYLHTKVLTRQQINLLPPLNGGMSEA